MFDVTKKYKEAMMNREEFKIPDEAIKSAIVACFHGLLYDMDYLQLTTERDSTANDVNALRQRLDKYMECMQEVILHGNSVLLREEAYLSICDLLIFFSRSEMKRNTVLASLVYNPDQALAALLNDFVQSNVFVEEMDDEQDDHTKIEELHKRRNFLASFAKLIVYNVLPTKSSADVLKHYVSFYNDYGDIIKAILSKARENNKVNCAKTMAQALIIKYKEIKAVQNQNVINRSTGEFYALKELAKRFALSFGLDAVKNREAVTALHREGILVSVNPLENPEDPTGPPPNLPFLEILSEFTNKLLKQDKKVVLNYLDKRIANATPSRYSLEFESVKNMFIHMILFVFQLF